MNSQDVQREKLSAFRGWTPALTLSLGLVAGYGISEVMDDNSDVSTADPSFTKADAKKLLDNVDPCEEDPFNVVFNDQSHVIVDVRCREATHPEGVAVYSSPTDSVLGPIASVDDGTAVQALCKTRGSIVQSEDKNHESNEWIMVNLQSEKGVKYKADANVGFINSMDVVAESDLSECSNNNTETA